MQEEKKEVGRRIVVEHLQVKRLEEDKESTIDPHMHRASERGFLGFLDDIIKTFRLHSG